MGRQRVITPTGAWSCVVLSLACCAAAFFLFGEDFNDTDFGICIPSPNLWPLLPAASWGINTALILACGATISLINKKHSLIRGTDTPLTPLFLLLCGSNLFLSRGLSSGMIMLPAALLACILLFESYRARNATQQMFVTASFLGLGSMCNYSFIPLAGAVIISGIIMQCFRAKETCAFLLGLAAPYWVGVGFGLLGPSDFRLPRISSLAIAHYDTSLTFTLFTGCAVLLVIAALLALNNAVRLYAGNSRIRSENNVVNVLGVVAALCMAFDFTNILAYTGIFNFWVATQFSNFFALTNMRKSWILLLVIVLTITGMSVALLLA